MFKCNECHILRGPEDNVSVPKESIGKIIFDCLRKRDPEKVVAVDGITGKMLTCGELLQNSIKATQVFKNLGLEKGDVVTIISENSLNYCVPMLAALYMGVTVNLLNPHYAYGELKHALGTSRPKVVFCSEMALENVFKVCKDSEHIKEVILTGSGCLQHKTEGLKDLLNSIPTTETNFHPEDLNCSEHVAFILMSSGTTGLPKGVLLTHQNFRALVSQMVHSRYGNFTSQDTLLLVLPVFHILSLGVLMAALVASMKAVLLKKFQPDYFLQSIQEYKVNKLVAVPTLLLFLVKSHLIKKYDLLSVKDILTAGAPTGTQLLNETAKRLNGVTVRQAYGITETSGGCTYQSVTDKKPGSVGALVPEITAKVWDYNLKKNLGPMEIGELCFKGPMIMKGYLGNPVATQECIDEEGFFYTGDLGYYDLDGHLYIVGRLKEIIKYKGFQVSPVELEALIVTHPGVKDCGVIGIPNKRAGEVPLAYVVPQTDANVTEQDIVSFVAERISVEKHLYGGVVFVEDIPKNASGKILRGELRSLFQKGFQGF